MPDVISFTRDLIFSTKIGGTAAALDISAVAASTLESLLAGLDVGDVRLVIVDMSLPQEEALAALRSGAGHPSRPTAIAFYSHVQSELLEAAEQAGADLAITRSKFSANLPELLNHYCPRTSGCSS